MSVIPIRGTAADVNGCDEKTGEAPRPALPLARREFLRGSGILMGTIAAGSALAALAPSPVWAVELKVLSKNQGAALMKLGRPLYPQKKLPNPGYALLAKDTDGDAADGMT